MSTIKEDGLDAAFIIDQARGRSRKPSHYLPEPPPHEDETRRLPDVEPSAAAQPESKRRRGKAQDYENLFIHDTPSSTRSGKTVYIRKEFHERITRIVQVIGRNEISLYSYLDNVLSHHFDTFQDDISTLYKQRDTDIF
ncbi:DUF3408 domain-containing protein [Alistipes finegoldii]|uniref:DUF3408 domain-containing protein n=1 Tax=Alistipes finegoldii TaxID=214856 RepID=UPI00242B665D|nr:DUF3408 domain-containing protein [Alistipes finegoldii]